MSLIIEMIGDLISDSITSRWTMNWMVRRRRKVSVKRLSEGYLRCVVRRVEGKVPAIFGEWADVELELRVDEIVCRRRDDRSRAIPLSPARLDNSASRQLSDDNERPMAATPLHRAWQIITPRATLDVLADEDLLIAARALVHPPAPTSPADAPAP